jgi:acyl-CoA reductase-like NAD-dependent aldehyde dehydrogenase
VIAETVFDVCTLVGSRWIRSSQTSEIRYPYDNSVVGVLHHSTPADVAAAVEAAIKAFAEWRKVPAFQRAERLTALARLVETDSNRFATMMTLQTGKTIRDSESEVQRSISTLLISAEEAKRIDGEVIPMDAVPSGTGKIGFTIRVPMGVIAGISPFNAPLNTICHKLGPALAAGNTFVLKPHPQGSGLASLLAQACLDVSIPPGVFNLVHGGPEIGRALTTHKAVSLVNFTGSGTVATQILKDVGLKRVLLELGGNAPTIVCADANLESAVPQCCDAGFGLNGQSCISTQRIYAHIDIYEEFVEALTAMAAKRKAGDPTLRETALGPMISEDAANRVERWIAEAISAGAKVTCGGTRRGTLLDATVLVDVKSTMRVVCDEIFGPVVVVIPFNSLSEALYAANDTPWGLKAGIFTNDLHAALTAAKQLDYGTININAPSRSRSDHEPSGGVKQSGWGKEGPRYAIQEMTYVKMITIA